MNSVVIDTNVFILLIIGMINPKKIPDNKRTSIYNETHYNKLVDILAKYDKVYTSPNIVTEIDNLLNKTSGEDRYKYFKIIQEIINKSTEKYLASSEVVKNWYFQNVGITDSIVLLLGADSDLLISGDSEVCDYARSMGINTFDFKQYVNEGIV